MVNCEKERDQTYLAQHEKESAISDHCQQEQNLNFS